MTSLATALGQLLADAGVRRCFGVVGSGNYAMTSAMVEAGVSFVAARHEQGAAAMADAYSRLSGEVAVCTTHQGCGLTNALTALVEAAKSRSPLLLLTADTAADDTASNFWIDQAGALAALGVAHHTLDDPATALSTMRLALRQARHGTVAVNVPVDVASRTDYAPADYAPADPAAEADRIEAPAADPGGLDAALAAVQGAERPVILAGRGARAAANEIIALADRIGALLGTTAVTRGLFLEHPWSLDVIGGFSPPAVAELVASSDLVLSFGASLNRWTTRNGTLIGDGTTLVRVDHRPTHSLPGLLLRSDSAWAARELSAAMPAGVRRGYRTAETAELLQRSGTWAQVPFSPAVEAGRIDPRELTLALDAILPVDRIVVSDGGNFMLYPSMFLRVGDAESFCFPHAFQAIGMGLSAAIGAALARPGQVVACGVGDGGFMMGLSELDTAVRLALPLVVIVYNDGAYGAEYHHFRPTGASAGTVTFPPTDIASVARGIGCDALRVERVEDLDELASELRSRPPRPLVLDARISSFPSWVMEHAFAGRHH